jgi:hypothetical protein
MRRLLTVAAVGALVLSSLPAMAVNADGSLTEAELSSMITKWEDPGGAKKIALYATVGSAKGINKKYLKQGTTPFRITASLMETAKGQRYGKRVTGTAHFYLQDSTGTVVQKKDVSLAKMCPS